MFIFICNAEWDCSGSCWVWIHSCRGFGSSIALERGSWEAKKGKFTGVLNAHPDRGFNVSVLPFVSLFIRLSLMIKMIGCLWTSKVQWRTRMDRTYFLLFLMSLRKLDVDQRWIRSPHLSLWKRWESYLHYPASWCNSSPWQHWKSQFHCRWRPCDWKVAKPGYKLLDNTTEN